jgi:hypothetical protein
MYELPAVKSWTLAVLLGALVAGAWTWLTLGAQEETSGPTIAQMIVAALALWAILTWRTRAWMMKRLAGVSLGSILARSLGEGAIVGALIGAGAYALAIAQDGTPIVDLFIVLVVSVWAVLGAGVFFALAVVAGLAVRFRATGMKSGRVE